MSKEVNSLPNLSSETINTANATTLILKRMGGNMIADEDFKSIRHRFYKLGKKRNIEIFQDLGKIEEGENPDHDETKEILTQLKNENRTYDLISAIQFHEKEIQKEREVML
jgi:hypothetical protein